MDHNDHVRLLRKGIAEMGGVWADLGSGSGAFTLALADILGPSAHIYSVDKDQRALNLQERELRSRFPQTSVQYIHADFTNPLDLPPLDGIVMANSLHFVRKQDELLRQIHDYLRPEGRLLLVEYNTDRSNTWIPYPLSFPTWQALAARHGFVGTTLLEDRPSRYSGSIYSALSFAN
jgi:ubiquinone/menaquinone biosynthesis C-methylase UbiE